VGEAGTEQDAALVRAAKAGDRAALVTLWHRHRPWLAAVILQHKPASVELEDLLQDVAAQLVAKLSSVSEPAALVGWLKATAVNAARWAGRKHEVRERHARLVGQGALARAAEAAGLAEPEARAGEMGGRVAGGAQRSAGAVLELARGLPAEYGEPLLLRAVQGLSYRQIGAILGLPESTVETRIARGRRMLREAAVRGSVAGIRVRGDGAGVSAGAGRAG
jgi:RNA polymerase sigma-70 factor (ECF subfamily)